MGKFRHSEMRGILVMLLIAFVLGGFLAGTTGMLEQWFGITWFSGPELLDKVIFICEESGQKRLCAVNTDGSHKRVLISKLQALAEPDINPTGTRIVFVAKKGKESQIYSVNGKGDGLEQMSSANGAKHKPLFSPDGSKLAFIAGGKVYVADANGDDARYVLPYYEEVKAATTQRNELPSYSDYVWGPDSKSMLAVTSDESGNDILVYLQELHGEAIRIPFPSKDRTRVKGLAVAKEAPRFTVSVTMGEESFLAIMGEGVDGIQPMAVSNEQVFGQPALSPDGNRFVAPVRSKKDSSSNGLAFADMESGNGGLLVKGNFANPAFSPDGKELVAVKTDSKGKNGKLVKIDFESRKDITLVKSGSVSYPIWSPACEEDEHGSCVHH